MPSTFGCWGQGGALHLGNMFSTMELHHRFTLKKDSVEIIIYVCSCALWYMCGSQEKLVGSVLSLPLVGLNSDHQACTIKQQAPFSAEPSHQPTQRMLKLGSTTTVGVLR